VDDFTLATGFDFDTIATDPDNRAIVQRAWMTAKATEPKHLNEFLAPAFKSWHTLFKLSAQTWLPRVGIRAVSKHPFRMTYLYCEEHRPTATPRRRREFELLFAAQELGDEWPNCFRRWHEARAKYGPTFDIYFSLLRTPSLLLEYRFLNLIGGERRHR
jgi:hypothetical protein